MKLLVVVGRETLRCSRHLRRPPHHVNNSRVIRRAGGGGGGGGSNDQMTKLGSQMVGHYRHALNQRMDGGSTAIGTDPTVV